MVCEWCGKEFTPNPHGGPKQRFCNANCKRYAWRASRPGLNQKRCREYYARLDGLRYERRKLVVRRAQAVYRRRLRSAGAKRPGRLEKGETTGEV